MVEDVNKHISTAKRLWNQSKRFIGKSDKIERSENALFVNDEALAQLVVEREQKEQEIIQYIENRLNDSRNVLPTKADYSKFTAPVTEGFLELYSDNGSFKIVDGNTVVFQVSPELDVKLFEFKVETDLSMLVSILNYLQVKGVINFQNGDLQWFIQ